MHNIKDMLFILNFKRHSVVEGCPSYYLLRRLWITLVFITESKPVVYREHRWYVNKIIFKCIFVILPDFVRATCSSDLYPIVWYGLFLKYKFLNKKKSIEVGKLYEYEKVSISKEN